MSDPLLMAIVWGSRVQRMEFLSPCTPLAWLDLASGGGKFVPSRRFASGTIDPMSDVGVIVTGVVVGSASGILGTICGAWLTARSQMAGLVLQITAEDERSKITDKRRVYAEFHAALDNLIIGNQPIKDSWATSSQDERGIMRAKVDAGLIALFTALSAVKLIAPKAISERAATLAQLMIDEAEGLLYDEANDQDDFGDDFLKQRSKLYRAMRSDLGASSLDAALEW